MKEYNFSLNYFKEAHFIYTNITGPALERERADMEGDRRKLIGCLREPTNKEHELVLRQLYHNYNHSFSLGLLIVILVIACILMIWIAAMLTGSGIRIDSSEDIGVSIVIVIAIISTIIYHYRFSAPKRYARILHNKTYKVVECLLVSYKIITDPDTIGNIARIKTISTNQECEFLVTGKTDQELRKDTPVSLLLVSDGKSHWDIVINNT